MTPDSETTTPNKWTNRKSYLYAFAGTLGLMLLIGNANYLPQQPIDGPAFRFLPHHLLGAGLSLYWLTIGTMRLLATAERVTLPARGPEAVIERLTPETSCSTSWDCQTSYF